MLAHRRPSATALHLLPPTRRTDPSSSNALGHSEQAGAASQQAQHRGGERRALTSGGVSAAACSVLPTHGLTPKPHSLLLATAWLPPGRQGRTRTFLAAEYDRSTFTTAVGLPVIVCSVDGALLTSQPPAPGAQFLTSPVHKTLAAHPAEVRPPAGFGMAL